MSLSPTSANNSPFFPLVTLGIAVLTSLFFALWPDAWYFSLVEFPHRLSSLNIYELSAWMSPISAMFSHSTVDHLGGNMLYLLLFGPIVEKRLGRGYFLLLYLLSGIMAAFGYGVINPENQVLGASGAIAGIMSVYPFVQRHWISMICAGLAVFFAFFCDFQNAWSGFTFGVAALAHVAGGVTGLLVFAWYRRELHINK